ncbi:hypothetical protein P6F34_gp71 [Pseudomonas phage MiCath]|uniref:Lipoprotein n=1 Tax=Pseudomonas phage MiCath TaxID=3003729 RepID=A0AAF0AEL4_9CAUD|nr:hypothetical protein P6F34_gp71 [Pseudomonas phage MiCath]WAX22420.1 hypothetical protein [Pseudomonas phage MiCath]
MGRMLAIMVLLALAAILGGCDYEDALQDAEQYCKMVYEGAWPDFNHNYDVNCKNGVLK